MGYVVDKITGVAYPEDNPPAYNYEKLPVEIPLTSKEIDQVAQQKFPNLALKLARGNICTSSTQDYYNDEIINPLERELCDTTNTRYGTTPAMMASDLIKLRAVNLLFVLDDSSSMIEDSNI